MTLALGDRGPTADVLEALGFERTDGADGRHRYRADAGDARGIGAVIDLVEGDERGTQGVGTVHHVAVAAADDDHQEALRQATIDQGLSPTEQIDRVYFRSVYVREPGGVLIEIATDGPGFTEDEDLDSLGESLALPP